MKKVFVGAVLLLISSITGFSQGTPLSFDGMYIAKTGYVEAAKVDIHTYLRFYKDGTVYLQAVSSNDPQTVAGWFGRFKQYSQKGTYKVNGTAVSMTLDNKGTEDAKLEGLQETSFKGMIKPSQQICLIRDAETKEFCFDFAKVVDTTKMKYKKIKPQIMLLGDWKVKQVLKSGQVFFTNEDSTIVGISIFTAANLPVYKESHNAFDSAYAYYEWDSNYMRDEEKMQVKKISENKEKAFVIWNAKDANNDNYHLFARHKDLMYNIMVYDAVMPVEKQLALAEALFELNKE